MNYGVMVSRDSFVFTRYGVVSINQLPPDSSVLGVEGIGKSTQFERVAIVGEEKATIGIRLITQATDSILMPQTRIFSERVYEAGNLSPINEIEFHNPLKTSGFNPGLNEKVVDLQPRSAYVIGLMRNIVHSSSKCLAFLIRDANDSEYISHIKQSVTNLADKVNEKIRIEINEGKLGHLWIVFKGKAVREMQRAVSEISPERACIDLSPELLREFVAGMLDAYVSEPFYGGDPVITFSIEDSVPKRFLQNALSFYNSRIFETSCITSYAPKFLESMVFVGEEIPTRNPIWSNLSESSEGPRLFSRVRGWLDIETSPANLVFEKEGFSPIVDGLYTYPSVLSD